MTADELTRAWFDNVWNKKDTSFIYKHMSRSSSFHGLPKSAQTPEGFVKFQQVTLDTIKGLHVTILDSVESDNKVIGIGRVTGIYFENKQPVDFNFAYMAIVENDKIVEALNIIDFVEFLSQCGRFSYDPVKHALAAPSLPKKEVKVSRKLSPVT